MTDRSVLERPRSEYDHAQLARTQRLESVGALAGGMAQDLNTILTPILMSITLLSEQIDDAESRRLLNLLETSARRGATMVRQIQEFSRGLDPLDAAVDLRILLEDLRHLIAGTFPRSIELVVEIAPGVTAVHGDLTPIQQVLVNFCVNARDAMPAGGRLVLRAEPIDVNASDAAAIPDARPGRYMMVSVSDTGSGTWANVSTSRAVVRARGGFLTVTNAIGRGTTVRAFFPAAGPADGGQHRALGAAPRGRGELILVVDAEASVRSMTALVLSAWGYTVATAANGAEAVAEFARRPHEFAAVLTDMMVPLMDGACTMRALRTIDPDVKLVVASGLDTRAGIAGDIPQGAAVLPKPFRAEALLIALRQILDEPSRRG